MHDDDLRSRVAEEYDIDTADPLWREMLEQACQTEQTILELEALVRSDGLVSTGSRGQVRVHPAVAELRAQRAAYARLLIQLGVEPTTARTARHRGRG
jgi:phage terminase small subunit